MENFNFKNFIPSEDLRIKANRALDRIIERAPSDARITANLEKTGERFHCSIEIGSANYPITVNTTHKFASIALDKAEIALLRKLDSWCRTRFISFEKSPFRSPIRATS